MPRALRAELAPFQKLNEDEKKSGKKISWKERYAIICEQFPSVDRINWVEAFNDLDLWGRIVKDLLEEDQKATDGVRRPLDEVRASQRLRQLMGVDFAYLPFVETFKVLAGNRSVRNLARKIGLSTTMTFDLRSGARVPDAYALEQIAGAFNKDPSYFVEYRVAYIVQALADHMSLSPETTVDLFKRLRRTHEGQ